MNNKNIKKEKKAKIYSFCLNFISKSLICFCALFLAGFMSFTEGNRLGKIEESDRAGIVVNESLISDVTLVMGRPIIKDTFFDKELKENMQVYIYGMEEYYSFLFIKKKAYERELKIYYFDGNGVLRKVSELDLKEGSNSRLRSIRVMFKKPNKAWALPFYTIF